jgi:hypothetical protein
MKTFKNLFLEDERYDSYYAMTAAKRKAKEDGKVWDKLGKDVQDKYISVEMEKKGYEKKDGASRYTKKSKSPEEIEKDKERKTKNDAEIAARQKERDDKNAQDLKPREEKSPEEHAKMVDEFVKNSEYSVQKFVEAGQASVALEIFIGRQENQLAKMQDRFYDIQSKASEADENGQTAYADRMREKEYDLEDEIYEAEDILQIMQDDMEDELKKPSDGSKPFEYKMVKSSGSTRADKVVRANDKRYLGDKMRSQRGYDQVKREKEKNESYDPSVHERGTDAGRKWAQEFTPGQSVDSFIKEDIKRQKDFSAKTFSQVVGNPLEGYPYNEEMQVNEVAQDKDIEDKEGTQPAKYHKGLSKSTKQKRDAHFKAKKSGEAPGDADAETKPSKHTVKAKQMFGEDSGLQAKADKSGISKGILQKVYNRGLAAYKTGHRPGTTAPQWAMARVNSFITKGKGTWGGADQDLAKQAKGKSEEVEESRYSDEKNKRQKATLKKHDSAMIKVARKSIKKYDANNKNKNEDVEEACWNGYKQVGMKKKGNKEVPNCVPEANTMGNVKKTLSKVKGLTSDQLKTLMTIPQSQLMVIAQQLSGLVMGEEIHESQIETHLPQLDEVMSMQTRLKMKKAFRKNKHKIAIGRKKAAKRMVLDPKKIEKRATKAARKVLEKKFLKGADKNSLGHAGKAALEKKIEKKKSVIAKIARKLKKVIRKKESMKFKKNKETWDKAGKDLKSKK